MTQSEIHLKGQAEEKEGILWRGKRIVAKKLEIEMLVVYCGD